VQELTKVGNMKKRIFGKTWLCLGSLLTVAFACQSPSQIKPSSQPSSETQNPASSDDEDDDGDDGAYGDGDTSAFNQASVSSALENSHDLAPQEEVANNAEQLILETVGLNDPLVVEGIDVPSIAQEEEVILETQPTETIFDPTH
jgi:hypothetical protein